MAREAACSGQEITCSKTNDKVSARKKNLMIEFTSIAYEYKKAGKYKVMVKVVDILGIDTSKIIEVVV
ncbi:MAG: hypothetical protein U5K79_07785 [Cyclobacteriaceae bacterium]|nr:hypothetical protein [Cyclobacteriaceae bacterium]